MHPSFRLARQPLIKFIGKRTWAQNSPPHAHPAAPPEYRKAFTFGQVAAASSSSSSKMESKPLSSGNAFAEFWDAPERTWKPKVRELEDDEINAVLSGGASLY